MQQPPELLPRFERLYQEIFAGATDKKPYHVWLKRMLERKTEHDMERKKGDDSCRCRYCKNNFKDYGLMKTWDHIIPLARGGYSKRANLVRACADCNEWKGHKSLAVWHEELCNVLHNKQEIVMRGYTKQDIATMITSVEEMIQYIDKMYEVVGRVKLIG